MKCVNTDKIPSIPNAPFSQGMIVGGLLFMSGQVLTFRTSELSTKSTGSISLGNPPDPVLL